MTSTCRPMVMRAASDVSVFGRASPSSTRRPRVCGRRGRRVCRRAARKKPPMRSRAPPASSDCETVTWKRAPGVQPLPGSRTRRTDRVNPAGACAPARSTPRSNSRVSSLGLERLLHHAALGAASTETTCTVAWLNGSTRRPRPTGCHLRRPAIRSPRAALPAARAAVARRTDARASARVWKIRSRSN